MQTGTPPGETGSGDQKNTTLTIEQAKANWAGILEPMLAKSTKLWVNELMGLMPLSIAKTFSSASLAEKVRYLDAELAQLDDHLANTPRHRIIKSLGVIAEVLQVELPSAEALRIYAQLLEEIPDVAWNETCQQVLKEHKYNTLPKPADFLRAAQPLCGQAQSVVKLVEHTRNKITAAIEIRGELYG